jgi:heterodisulfide reductase subunit A
MPKIKAALEQEQMTLSFPDLSQDTYSLTKIKPSACSVACPAGINVKAYVGLIVAGKFQEALDLIKEDNPLPGICGRVCTHPCESECNRNDVDEAVAICALKRFVADWELKKGKKREKPIKKRYAEKVAIIGSGPAGLTCANDLVRKGYPVTIFEKFKKPGGMLTWGIPSYRLPRDIIKKEIEAITNLGVELKTNIEVGKDITIAALKKKGYKAFFFAVGAYKGLKLGIPGEDDYKGFIDCLEFLIRVNGGDHTKPGKKVIVIGGGNSAIDAARTALRLGCQEVHIVYRRSRKEMPANPAEVEAAEEEGIKIRYLATPVRILGKAGKVTGMECIEMKLGEPDASGRRRPIPIEGTEFTINADTIIPAISQKPDLSFLPKTPAFKLTKWNTFEVDEETLATNIKGFFAGGDAVTGPNTVIDAIAQGHTAAFSIDSSLRSGKVKKPKTDERTPHSEWSFKMELEGERSMRRTPLPHLPRKKRIKSFDEVDLCLSEEQAIEEAQRCLRCGPCMECQVCAPGCRGRLVTLDFAEGEMHTLILRAPSDPEKMPLGDRTQSAVISFKDSKKKGDSFSVHIEPLSCFVTRERCRGCGECEQVCRYGAITLKSTVEGIKVAEISEVLCKGCGTCVSVCLTGAIQAKHFSDSTVRHMVEHALDIK